MLPISIHAPRAGCDQQPPKIDRAAINFNPRTPCGVRQDVQRMVWRMIAISIHAPRAGCDTGDGVVVTKNEISIHAPRAGCDVAIPDSFVYSLQFQSTHPVRGATGSARRRQVRSGISIHAPRAGCDNAWRYITRRQTDFNPRTPCGVRLRRCLQSTQTATFQSTHPVRGATANLTVLPGQICAKGTKKSLFSRKNAQKRK